MEDDRMTHISETLPEVLRAIEEKVRAAEVRKPLGNHKGRPDRWTTERWDRYATAVLTGLIAKHGLENTDDGDDAAPEFLGIAMRVADQMRELVEDGVAPSGVAQL